MSQLLLHNIFQVVKSDFCGLIDFKMRGDTIEIITSIPTITNSYVSVFVSHKDGTYAISDGGWISRNSYEGQQIEDTELLLRIYEQYKEHFKIKETKSPDGIVYYYKKADKLELVSAMVFDVGHFIGSIVNTQNIIYKEVEDADRKLFHTRMNGFLRERFPANKLELNTAVQISETQKIRFNAVVHANARDHYYVMYVTGSRSSFFIKDLTEATVNYEIINDQAIKKEHFKKVALINTAADGYDKEKSGIYIEKLASALGHPPVMINNKNDNLRLAEAIPA